MNIPTSLAQEEFVSVQMVMDHLATRGDGDVLQKFVFSTQPVDAALIGLMDYYKETHILAMPSSLAIVRQAALNEDGIYVYVTGENVQIVASVETWQGLVGDPQFGGGSMLLAALKLAQIVEQHLNAIPGEKPPLHLLVPSRESVINPPPIYTQEDLQRVRDAAFAEGKAAAGTPAQ